MNNQLTVSTASSPPVLHPEPEPKTCRIVAPPLSTDATPVHGPRQRLAGLHISERRIVLMLGDLIMVSLALLAALWLRIPGISDLYAIPTRLFVLKLHWWLVLWGVWIPVSITADCYDLKRSSSARGAIYTATCALAASALYFIVPSISAPLTYSRLAWFIFALLAMIGVGGWRVIYVILLSQSTFSRLVLIVGAGYSGCVMAKAVDALAEATGVELVGFVDDNPVLQGQEIAGKKVLGTSKDLVSLAKQAGVSEVIVAITDPHRIGPDLLASLVDCWKQGVSVIPMSLYFEELTGSVPVEHIGQNLFALVDHQNQGLLRVWSAVRRVIDIGIGLVGLLFLAPLIPIIALSIWLDCPGPVFYRQDRIGQGGRTFRLFKFRSMIPNAEKNGVQWAQTNDDRVTRVGRFLRKARIDELPQFWNLLVGDMSLIGPRPERPEFVQQLDGLLPYYAIRHSIKPGITGWAQVRYQYGNSVDDSLNKLQYDLYYVKHRGPAMDALIALHTLRIMALMKGT